MLKIHKFLLKAAELALSDAFQICFESANDRLENAPLRLVEKVFTDGALTEVLNDIPDLNIKKWAQSFSFMDALTRRALKSTHFVCPVAKFIHEKVEEQSGRIEEAEKVTDVPF